MIIDLSDAENPVVRELAMDLICAHVERKAAHAHPDSKAEWAMHYSEYSVEELIKLAEYHGLKLVPASEELIDYLEAEHPKLLTRPSEADAIALTGLRPIV